MVQCLLLVGIRIRRHLLQMFHFSFEGYQCGYLPIQRSWSSERAETQGGLMRVVYHEAWAPAGVNIILKEGRNEDKHTGRS